MPRYYHLFRCLVVDHNVRSDPHFCILCIDGDYFLRACFGAFHNEFFRVALEMNMKHICLSSDEASIVPWCVA